MYVLTAKIEIAGEHVFVLDKVMEVEITRDSDKLTDECRLTLPKTIRLNGRNGLQVRRGDTVKVWLGYDRNPQLAFMGYVRDVGAQTPVVITCEDEMFRLKQQPAQKKSYRSVDLVTLLEEQNIGCGMVVMGEQNLGQYRVKADTVAGLLDDLARYGIRSFFRCDNGVPVLYSGVLFENGNNPVQVFATGLNIISDNNLKWQKAEDVHLRVKAVSLMPDNQSVTVEIGDEDGECRTLHVYNKSKEELKAWAEQEVKRLKCDGLTGSFTTFGYRLADKLDVVGIKLNGVKCGIYRVKKNVIKYSTGGFRQEITLGQRVTE